jgi:prevent-host-death family protein
MSETVSFDEAHARLGSLAERVETGHERIVVTRNGRPSFVLVSPNDLDALEDDLASVLTRSHRGPFDGRWSALRLVPDSARAR